LVKSSPKGNKQWPLAVLEIVWGAAWRNLKDGPEFDRVLEMVHSLNKMAVEVCCSLK